MKKHLLIVFMSIYALNSFCQSYNLKGTIVGQDSIPVDYFFVQVLNRSDNSYISGSAFQDGRLELYLNKGNFLLKISSVQYNPKYIDVQIEKESDIIDLEKIVLTYNSLDEVTITGRKPIFRQEMGKMKINVSQSFLKDAGALLDVMQKIPGIIVDYQGNVSVANKGVPIIYINKKEVRDINELLSLSSTDIESIEIDRNPSAEYSASGHSVITIKTKKDTSDIYNVNASDNFSIGRKPSNRTNLSINYKNNKVINYLSYTYAYTSLKQYDRNEQTIIHPTDTLENLRTGPLTKRTNLHSIFYSFSYDINSKNQIGFQYSGSFDNAKLKKNNQQQIFGTNLLKEDRFVNTDRKSNFNLNNFNLNYEYKINKKAAFSIISDFAFSKNHQLEDILEFNASQKTFSNSEFKDKYQVFAAQPEYNDVFFDTNFKIGGKFSSVKDEGTYKYTDLTENCITDQITAGFISLSRKIGAFDIKAGIRAEYTDSKVDVTDNKNMIDTTYFKLFPSLSVTYNINDDININLSYSKRIHRPDFDQLNPRFSYLDSLSYIVGNPFLKPAIYNNIDLNFYVKDFSLSLGYSKRNNLPVQVGLQDDNNNSIIKYTYTNLNKGEYYNIDIDYSYNSKKLSLMAGLYTIKPRIKVEYLNEIHTLDKAMIIFQSSAEYKISDYFSVNSTYSYHSSGNMDLTLLKESSKLSFGLNQKLFKDKLQIYCRVEDILKTYRPNTWEEHYYNISSKMHSDADSRRFVVGIRYNVGKLKVNNKNKTVNQDERNRL